VTGPYTGAAVLGMNGDRSIDRVVTTLDLALA
jgi:hypothetical protein